MEQYNFSFRALGGMCEIKTHSMAWSKAEKLALLVEKEVLRIQNKFSRYLEDSVVSRINRNAGTSSVEIDEEVVALFDFAEVCFEKSSGEFDITSGILRDAWDFSEPNLPTKDKLLEILPLINFSNLSWSHESAYLSEPSMELDLGGLGKEYALERSKEICIKECAEYTLLNFSGDILAVGPKFDQSPWIVGIAHPRCKKSILCSRELYKGALITSGDYERYFILNGKRYCHILSAKTGFSPRYLQSCTVSHDSPLIAGALSTISFLLGPDRAKVLLEEQQAKYLFVKSSDEDSLGLIEGNLDANIRKTTNRKIVNIKEYAENHT